jgi:hypothetical protein
MSKRKQYLMLIGIICICAFFFTLYISKYFSFYNIFGLRSFENCSKVQFVCTSSRGVKFFFEADLTRLRNINASKSEKTNDFKFYREIIVTYSLIGSDLMHLRVSEDCKFISLSKTSVFENDTIDTYFQLDDQSAELLKEILLEYYEKAKSID